MVLADVAKRKANEIEARAITGSGKKIIIMSNQKKDTRCDRLLLLTSEMEGGIPITSSTRFLTSKLRFFPQALTSFSLITQRGIKSEHVCQSNIHVKFTCVSKMMSSSIMIKVFKCVRVKLVRKCKESQRSPLFLSLLQAVLLPFHKHSWKHIPEGIKLSSWLHTHRNTHTIPHGGFKGQRVSRKHSNLWGN